MRESDPTVADPVSWGLTAACTAQRRKKSRSAALAGPDVASQMRGLSGLPEEGAMRGLVQLLLTGNATGANRSWAIYAKKGL